MLSPRTLSPTESKLVMELEWEESKILSLQDIMQIAQVSYPQARHLAHTLQRKRWLDRIAPGTYQFIPASRGREAVPDMNPLLVGSVLVSPYYYSYATANHHYGFTPQVPATVYVATMRAHRPVHLRGTTYRFVALTSDKFFGFQPVRVLTAQVMMAEPEKALVDSLDKLHYAGGIVEVTAILSVAPDQVSWEKVGDYALRMKSCSLVQRLGYLADLLHLPLSAATREKLHFAIQHSKTYLGPTTTWGTGGHYDTTWQVIVNVPAEHLLSDAH
jgi:predicted transcriptional regulator of viral defense system